MSGSLHEESHYFAFIVRAQVEELVTWVAEYIGPIIAIKIPGSI